METQTHMTDKHVSLVLLPFLREFFWLDMNEWDAFVAPLKHELCFAK